MGINEQLKKFHLPKDTLAVIKKCTSLVIPKTRAELETLSFGGDDNAMTYDVGYNVNGKWIKEVDIVRCKNGVSINFPEDYMRARDPKALISGDEKPSDRPKFEELFGEKFDRLRAEMLDWLSNQELILVPFRAGGSNSHDGIMLAPKNAACLGLTLSDLQFLVNIDDVKKFSPKVVIYFTPTFRHTYFKGKQAVVGNRTDEVFEIFANNFYPGPSAKKGIFGFLLEQSETGGYAYSHASAVKVITPYDNEMVIMHEGASGGGKSEIGEPIHREPSGKILVSTNTQTNDQFRISLNETCELRQLSDDVTVCKTKNDRLFVKDAEASWFVRVDHITHYGTSPEIEKFSIHNSMPLIFLNIDATPGSTALLWNHTLNSDGKPCPNARVIVPRHLVADPANEFTEVDVRSFGVRTPPCTKENPSYGILGMIHFLPPALAWLWRLVSPRGHNNPSISQDNDKNKKEFKLETEGIGSYGPFFFGNGIAHANMLLDQIINSSSTRYVLFPNQYIGAHRVGFMPEWISREYMARRGCKFKKELLLPARCPLLGFSLDSLKIDGQYIKRNLLQPEMQAEVGTAGYDAGSAILAKFFKKELQKFLTPELNPLGRKIIEAVMRDAKLEEYLELIPMRY